VHTGPRYACGFPNSVVYDYITKLCTRQAEIIHNHECKQYWTMGNPTQKTLNA
jgi:hypothetical protein